MKTFILFGYHQAMSCLFPAVIFGALALSQVVDSPFMARYDFILLICVLAQVLMLVCKLETFDEFKVICLFHVVGLGLELYKVHMGSWSYPEEAYSKFYGVPLYSGFMYASVASYICQAWRRLDLRMVYWPKAGYAVLLCVLIYGNFFTHHFLWDMRWILKLMLFLVFFRTVVFFTVNKKMLKMPMVLAFFLIGFFIWIAENIVTFYGAWTYPNQEEVWSIVDIGKISSWFLLCVISVIIVAQLKRVKDDRVIEKVEDKSMNEKI